MGLSLRDQLLQAGLLSEKQAKQANKQQHHQRREQARKAAPVLDEQTLAAQRAAEEKRQRDIEANRALLEKVQEKERRAEVRQLVEKHRLPKIDSFDYYHFIAGRKVKRMPVDAERRAKLVSGALVIINCDGNFEVVPKAIAERIRERDARAVIAPQSGQENGVDDNDPYKDYVVPDDLVW